MTATKLMCQSLDVNCSDLSKKENLLLEADLLTRISEILHEMFKVHYENYFRILKFNTETEKTMLETNLTRCVLNDILSTGEYSLPGIACYTNTSEDVIFEIISGINTDPSLSLFRKIIELHRSIRAALYREIMNKIISQK